MAHLGLQSHGFSSFPPPNQSFPVGGPPPKSAAQLRCEANGGLWDRTRDACILPDKKNKPKEIKVKEAKVPFGPQQPEEIAEEIVRARVEDPEIFTSDKTGRPSGITIPGRGGKPDRDFLGLSPKDVAEVAALERRRDERPEETVPVGTAAAAATEFRRKVELAKRVGVIDYVTASIIEAQGLNVKEYLRSGLVGIGPSAIVGATGAATVGLIGGPGTSAVAGVIGATGGAIQGFYSGVTRNIKSQRQDLVTLKPAELKIRIKAINDYISMANINPLQAEDYIIDMNLELSLIKQDYYTLLRVSEPNLVAWGSDATVQIAKYDVFFETGQPALEEKMRQAIARPDPARAFIVLDDSLDLGL